MRAGLLALTLLFSSGCLMAGNYHSARTLQKGTSSFGMNFSMNRYEYTESESGEKVAFVLPNLIPEVTYHIGVDDNVEVGGRFALGSFGLEGDLKWRFFTNGRLHMAIAPALGYQGVLVIQGTTVRLPGILTYDLNDQPSVNLALVTSTTKWETVPDSGLEEELAVFDGTLQSTSAAFGIELRAATFVIRPSVEFTRYLWDFDDSDDSFEGFTTVNAMVHLAWIGGQEKQQLDRIERKIDGWGPPPAR